MVKVLAVNENNGSQKDISKNTRPGIGASPIQRAGKK
jgi:hypothetical protein